MEMNGLVVDYDGNKNIVMYKGIHEYPIGGMIAEYARIKPTEIKEIIMRYKDNDKKATEEYLASFFPWFVDELEKKFGTVPAVMITFEFMDFAVEFLKMSDKERNECLKEKKKAVGEIYKFIFEDTNCEGMGIDNIKQFLLACYVFYAEVYVVFKHSFNMLATEEKYDENEINGFWSLFDTNMDFQHIDFKIACYEGQFHSLYTIKSSISLMLFEAAHYLDSDVKLVKCANCGDYFVPEGRNDTIYCNNAAPQNVEKTCREIGAQVTRANKEKNDIVTKAYRKVYMKYKMITIRHPEDIENKKKFNSLTENVKDWRKKMTSGLVSVEDFLNWLNQF